MAILSGCSKSLMTREEANNYNSIIEFVNKHIGQWPSVERNNDGYRMALTPNKLNNLYPDILTICRSNGTNEKLTELYWHTPAGVPTAIPQQYLNVAVNNKAIGLYKCRFQGEKNNWLWVVESQPIKQIKKYGTFYTVVDVRILKVGDTQFREPVQAPKRKIFQ